MSMASAPLHGYCLPDSANGHFMNGRKALFLPLLSVMELRSSAGGMSEHGVARLTVTWWLQKSHVKSGPLGAPAPSALTGSALSSGPALARARPRPLIGSRWANPLSRCLGALMLTLFWGPGYPGRAGLGRAGFPALRFRG